MKRGMMKEGGRMKTSEPRMDPEQFLKALTTLGIYHGQPIQQIDIEAAKLMQCDTRTIRRWRLGERAIPGPVIALLECWERARKVAKYQGKTYTP